MDKIKKIRVLKIQSNVVILFVLNIWELQKIYILVMGYNLQLVDNKKFLAMVMMDREMKQTILRLYVEKILIYWGEWAFSCNILKAKDIYTQADKIFSTDSNIFIFKKLWLSLSNWRIIRSCYNKKFRKRN